MADIAIPQPGRVTRPVTPAAPQPRAMDTYDATVAEEFRKKEETFFGSHPHTKDENISFSSPFGHFRISTYPNQGNVSDLHYVVLFHNKATQETFEVHGTIARRYIELVRNRSGVQDFPISDSRTFKADSSDSISYFSRYALHWDRATNGVAKRFYKPYDPDEARVAARLHDYDPTRKSTLVGYTEEYAFPSEAIEFSNWKDERDLGKYNGSIGIRAVGMPSQILLHETAGFGDMSIPNVRQETTSSGGTFFPIPHFCVNNVDNQGRGHIIQFVDVATNVPHGEVTNTRAVGIEFVNAPIEAYKTDEAGRALQPLEPQFNLVNSQRGIYLKTKLAGLPRLFIPLQFSAEAKTGYYEVAIKKDKLLNFTSLNEGLGAAKQKIVFGYDDNVVIKYAKADMFEHLATLMTSLVTNKLINGVADLTAEQLWKPVVQVAGKTFYIFEHGWQKRRDGTHHFVDIRQPGVLTHLLIGGHVDGGTQGLYQFLRLAKRLSVDSVMSVMVEFLTGQKTSSEAAGIELSSKVLVTDAGMQVPATPVRKTFKDVLELDQTLFSGLTSPQ